MLLYAARLETEPMELVVCIERVGFGTRMTLSWDPAAVPIDVLELVRDTFFADDSDEHTVSVCNSNHHSLDVSLDLGRGRCVLESRTRYMPTKAELNMAIFFMKIKLDAARVPLELDLKELSETRALLVARGLPSAFRDGIEQVQDFL